MAYSRFRSAWKNRPDTSTPITAEALDHFENGVKAAHDALDGRLSNATLNATYVRTVNGSTPDGAGNVTVTGGGSGVLPTMTGLVTRLDAAESAAFSVIGDSTGDTDGTDPAQDRLTARFARRLAEAYPGHHVLFKHWDPVAEGFKPWTVMQAKAAGRRYANLTNRSMRYIPQTAAESQVSSKVLDLRILVAPNQWVTGAGNRVLITRYKSASAGAGANNQFRFLLNGNGYLVGQFSWLGSNWLSEKISTAAVAGTDGQPLWLRCVIAAAGTGWSFKFYTSPAVDGVTWTQLGTTVENTGATDQLYAPTQDTYFEIGAAGWQPAAETLAGKVYEVQIRDGENGRCMTPCLPELWERYGDSATTFGGAPTLHVLNASRSSAALSYHSDATRLPKETPNYGQSVVIINDSHNEVSNVGSTWIPPYEALVTAVKGRLPSAAINVVGQNPHTSAWANEAAYGREHVTRIMELSAAAARNGWGFLNVYQAYLDDPRGLGVLIGPDGLHPTQAGYFLTGDTVAAAAGI